MDFIQIDVNIVSSFSRFDWLKTWQFDSWMLKFADCINYNSHLLQRNKSESNLHCKNMFLDLETQTLEL